MFTCSELYTLQSVVTPLFRRGTKRRILLKTLKMQLTHVTLMTSHVLNLNIQAQLLTQSASPWHQAALIPSSIFQIFSLPFLPCSHSLGCQQTPRYHSWELVWQKKVWFDAKRVKTHLNLHVSCCPMGLSAWLHLNYA